MIDPWVDAEDVEVYLHIFSIQIRISGKNPPNFALHNNKLNSLQRKDIVPNYKILLRGVVRRLSQHNLKISHHHRT
jgi:hypothetical protein